MTTLISQENMPQYNCNKVAVLSDIHSNYYAFKACVDDAAKQGADCFVFLGDYVSGLADTEKTMKLVYEIQSRYPTVCIRGNRERYMLDHHNGVSVLTKGSYTGAHLFTYDCLSAGDIEFFSGLPISDVIIINGVPIEIAHATMENDRFYFEQYDSVVDEIVSQMSTRCLLTGHSHKQYSCCRGDKTIINPGSVGLPQGSGQFSQYVILNVIDGKVEHIFRQVEYDLEAVIHSQFNSGIMDYGKYWAICDLYGAIEGEEYTKQLLTMIYQREENAEKALGDETIWHEYAIELNLGVTEEEALNRLKEVRV